MPVVSVGLLALFTGCTAQAEPPSGGYRRFETPPDTPPVVELAGTRLPAAGYDWVQDGRPVRFREAADDQIMLPRVTVTPGELLVIRIGSPVMPAQLGLTP